MSRDDPPQTTDEFSVDVPAAHSGDEVVAWFDADMRWLAEVRRARTVHEQMVERYIREPGVECIERGRGPVLDDGRAMQTIGVTLADAETAERLDLPDHVHGIPIVVEFGRVIDTA